MGKQKLGQKAEQHISSRDKETILMHEKEQQWSFPFSWQEPSPSGISCTPRWVAAGGQQRAEVPAPPVVCRAAPTYCWDLRPLFCFWMSPQMLVNISKTWFKSLRCPLRAEHPDQRFRLSQGWGSCSGLLESKYHSQAIKWQFCNLLSKWCLILLHLLTKICMKLFKSTTGMYREKERPTVKPGIPIPKLMFCYVILQVVSVIAPIMGNQREQAGSHARPWHWSRSSSRLWRRPGPTSQRRWASASSAHTHQGGK